MKQGCTVSDDCSFYKSKGLLKAAVLLIDIGKITELRFRIPSLRLIGEPKEVMM